MQIRLWFVKDFDSLDMVKTHGHIPMPMSHFRLLERVDERTHEGMWVRVTKRTQGAPVHSRYGNRQPCMGHGANCPMCTGPNGVIPYSLCQAPTICSTGPQNLISKLSFFRSIVCRKKLNLSPPHPYIWGGCRNLPAELLYSDNTQIHHYQNT